MNDSTQQTSPFNSPLESALRTVCLLYESYPVSLGTQRLVFYDYLVVHSGDMEHGPSSIHPPTPFRSNEWIVRRELIQQGIRLLIQRGLVEPEFSTQGIAYRASEEAGAYLACLTESYTLSLRERAKWVAATFRDDEESELVDFFARNLDRWGAEFEPIDDWKLESNE